MQRPSVAGEALVGLCRQPQTWPDALGHTKSISMVDEVVPALGDHSGKVLTAPGYRARKKEGGREQ